MSLENDADGCDCIFSHDDFSIPRPGFELKQ
jgi:hypothetical protein